MITAKEARSRADTELLEDLSKTFIEINTLITENPKVGELTIDKYYHPLDEIHQRFMLDYLQSIGYRVQQTGWTTILKW